MRYQLEDVDEGNRGAFCAYASAWGPLHDDSFLPRPDWLPGPSALLREPKGKAVGGLALLVARALLAAGKARLALFHSTAGREGYALLLSRARELAPPGVRRLFLFLPSALDSPGDYLRESGFAVERVALSLGREDLEAPQARLPPGWSLEALAPGQHGPAADFAAVRNRNFLELTGSAPTTAEDWLKVLDGKDLVPEGLVLLRDPEGQARASLLVEAEAPEDDSEAISIGALSVDPELRRQGLGRALLWHALSLGRRAGFSRAHLSVDSENDKALGLYRAEGFVLRKSMACWAAELEGIGP